MSSTGVLIVGAGQAGATAAMALRGFGYAGHILMVGQESHAPYERPPLSKAILAGTTQAGDIQIHAPSSYSDHAIDLLQGESVSALDTTAQTATLSSGGTIAYQHCLLATGGRARTVPGLAPNTPRVHYLRTLDDAQRLRAEMLKSRSVLIVGAGFLGLELASTARSLDLSTTVVEYADRVLNRVVPPKLSTWFEQRAKAGGIELKLSTRIEQVDLRAEGVDVVLASGEKISADLIVLAVGLIPEVDVARAAGLEIDSGNGGIKTDARGATSARSVFAAGDCCSNYHPFLSQDVRLESWQSANEQARIAAAAIAGVATEGLTAPWFWSDQFGCNLQMTGMPASDLLYRCRGDMSSSGGDPNFMLLGMNHAGQLLHAIAVNAGKDLRQLKTLIDSKTPCDAAALCDQTQSLRQVVRQTMAQVAATEIT